MEFKRRQSVPTVSSFESVQVKRYPRQSYYQSLNIQNVRQSGKLDARPINVTRKVLPTVHHNHSIDQRGVSADDTLQSISLDIFDLNDTNRLKTIPASKPSSISATSALHHSVSSQSKSNARIDTSHHSTHWKNDPSGHQYDRSARALQTRTNHQRILYNTSKNIAQCRDLTLKEQRFNQSQFTDTSRHKLRNKRRAYLKQFFACSPLCLLLSIGSLIAIGAIVAAITTALSSPGKTTITTRCTTITVTTTSSTTVTTTVTTTSVTTSTQTSTTTTTTDTPCSPTCTAQQMCVQRVCVNVGHLSCTLTWSRSGDGDIVVTTANAKTIYYRNKGPSATTDQAELDRDDLVGMGPENVYWKSSGPLPPTGTYFVCFEPYDFSNPVISVSNPLTIVYRIIRPLGAVLTFTKTFTSTIKNSYACSATSPTLIGSFIYP